MSTTTAGTRIDYHGYLVLFDLDDDAWEVPMRVLRLLQVPADSVGWEPCDFTGDHGEECRPAEYVVPGTTYLGEAGHDVYYCQACLALAIDLGEETGARWYAPAR